MAINEAKCTSRLGYACNYCLFIREGSNLLCQRWASAFCARLTRSMLAPSSRWTKSWSTLMMVISRYFCPHKIYDTGTGITLLSIIYFPFMYFFPSLCSSEGHLFHKFGISESDWYRIKQSIDSKCRTAWRRKQRGQSLAVKSFSKRTPRGSGSGNVYTPHWFCPAWKQEFVSDGDVKMSLLNDTSHQNELAQNPLTFAVSLYQMVSKGQYFVIPHLYA